MCVPAWRRWNVCASGSINSMLGMAICGGACSWPCGECSGSGPFRIRLQHGGGCRGVRPRTSSPGAELGACVSLCGGAGLARGLGAVESASPRVVGRRAARCVGTQGPVKFARLPGRGDPHRATHGPLGPWRRAGEPGWAFRCEPSASWRRVARGWFLARAGARPLVALSGGSAGCGRWRPAALRASVARFRW